MKLTTCDKSCVRRDHPRCRSATCGHTADVVICFKFHQNPFFEPPGGSGRFGWNLPIPITLPVDFYNSLHGSASCDISLSTFGGRNNTSVILASLIAVCTVLCTMCCTGWMLLSKCSANSARLFTDAAQYMMEWCITISIISCRQHLQPASCYQLFIVCQCAVWLSGLLCCWSDDLQLATRQSSISDTFFWQFPVWSEYLFAQSSCCATPLQRLRGMRSRWLSPS